MKKATGLMFLFMMLAIFVIIPQGKADAATTLKYGSSNGDVWDLQFRLNILGYYTDPMDGIYGSSTTDAIARFQKNYGLKADGVTGEYTWAKLKRVSVDQQELDIMAKIIHGEARGESYKGKVAVGAVVMNRVKSPLFPNNVREVAFQSGAFTAIDDGQYWLSPDSTAYRAAIEAVRGWDPSLGSLYYFNPNTATSSWIWSRPQRIVIDNHIFCL